MSANTDIEWADDTFSIAWGCAWASAGCDNCYAQVHARRFGFDVWGVGAPRRTFGAEYWAQPLKWNAKAGRTGQRRRVFCSSMTDVFLNDETIDRERNEKLWPLILATPNLDWLLLTKHPERFKNNLPPHWPHGYSNVYLMTSVEDNSAAWRVDALRNAPAAVRGLSVEPMLGPVDRVSLDGIDWVICGGESGPRARPMNPAWVRDLRDRCIASGVAFFFKQWGLHAPVRIERDRHFAGGYAFDDPRGGRSSIALLRHRFSDTEGCVKVGKGKAGRILGGQIWSQLPVRREA